MPSPYDVDAFETRVNYALACMRRGQTGSRAFDTCFEMWDGDYVVAAIWRRAIKNEKTKAVLYEYLRRPDMVEGWEKTADKLARLSDKGLRIEAGKHRLLQKKRMEKMYGTKTA